MTSRSILIGPEGVRSGWRFLSFLLVGGVLFLSLEGLVRRLGWAPPPGFRPLSVAYFDGLLLVAALLSAAFMSQIEGRTLADYALPLREAFGAGFGLGVVWGLAALSVLLLLIRVFHGYEFGTLALQGRQIPYYAASWAVVFLLVGLSEEFVFRGYALYTLSAGIGFWPAAFLLSALFGGAHLRNAGEAWPGALAAAFIGAFFCLTVRRTGSLWFAIGLHAAWDYAESFLFSVPDSGAMVSGHLLNSSSHGPRWITGGSVGPEGSVFAFVIIAGMFIIFMRLRRHACFPSVVRRPQSVVTKIEPAPTDN